MNDDFIKNYRREPTPEFRQALYTRISQPMNTQLIPTRRLRSRVFAVVFAFVVLCGVTLLTPAGRAFANQVLYRIGIFTVSEMPTGAVINDQPTAAPPTAPAPQVHADDATAASALAGFTVLDLAELPAGYTASDDWIIMQEGQRVDAMRIYADSAGHTLNVSQFKAAPGEAYTWELSPNETATPVDINGIEGLLIEGVLFGEGPFVNGQPAAFKSTNWLRWAVGDINYALSSDGLTTEQLVAIARTMR